MDRIAVRADLPYVKAPVNEGFAVLDPGHHAFHVAVGELVIVGRECWYRPRGGVGGRSLTACPACGSMMPSTAGPHPKGGWVLTPCVVTGAIATVKSTRVVEWRRLQPGQL